MTVEILHGDCLEHLAAMKAAGRTFASVVTDPPYGLGFMGKHWDAPANVAFRPDTWRLILDVLEPGGMLAAFAGSRTQHRIACAIEDSGFVLVDCALWLYGTGFPKAKTQLKPAYEPIILARKPTKGPLRPLAIDECRVESSEQWAPSGALSGGNSLTCYGDGLNNSGRSGSHPGGRWPANILHDGSDEVLEAFAAFGERGGGDRRGQCDGRRPSGFANVGAGNGDGEPNAAVYADGGTAARFFYCAKASKAERAGSRHPTIKPLSLVSWVVRLINPAGGTVLDPFAGSGTTGLACQAEGFDSVLIEREAEYIADCYRRLGIPELAAE